MIDNELYAAYVQHVAPAAPTMAQLQTMIQTTVKTSVESSINAYFTWRLLMDAAIAGVVALAAGFGLGWYVKGRGLTGVQTDATNVANETKTVVADVKAAV
jgi:hypothetical protein